MNDVKTHIQYNKLKSLLGDIPPFIMENIDFFEHIDEEYNTYAKNNRLIDGVIFSPKHIIDKNWIGLWYRATGMDSKLYINWLIAGLKNEEYKTKSLIYWYKEAHPNEKYVPYSIVKADEDFKKLMLNKNKFCKQKIV